MRDQAARLHVQRVESHVDLLVLMDEWKAKLDRDFGLIRAIAQSLSPDVKKAA